MNTIFHQLDTRHFTGRQYHRRLMTTALAFLLTTLVSVALAQTNTVLSCGDNQSGQIGDGTTTNRLLLTPAKTISGVKAIACGYNHTLALDSTGNVWAWGDNGLGQLGTGDTTNRATPVIVMSGIRAIAAGAAHSLALDYTGTVWAWGDNYSGELGTGGGLTSSYPYPMINLPYPVKAIACGGLHSLILDENGDLYGCGYNGYGQLGLGDNTDRSTPTFITNFVKGMAAGYVHTLIQTNDNRVYAAGYNGNGELGDGTGSDKNYFTSCGIVARSIAAGLYHSLAIAQNGKALAWGYNGYGELGTGDTANRYSPTLMPGGSNVKAVTGGGYHTLMLFASGKVDATGYNGYGQLGDGATATSLKLVPVKSATLIDSIAAGSYSSTLFKPYNKVLSTGDNNYGQLGIGGIVYISQVNSPRAMAIGTSIVSVSSGPSGWHSLMLRADGTVWACGDNDFGQLGQGTASAGHTIPLEVKGPGGVGYLTNIIAISAGNFHNMALRADGTVFTWGRNSHGQLGLGDTNDRYYPVPVPGISNVFTIAAGGYHSLLLANDGMMAGCGYNAYGQLGLYDTNDRSSFAFNGNFHDMLGLAGGHFHTLTLRYSYGGELGPCGLNSNGELGTGDTTNRYAPDAESGTLAVAMAGGGYHTLHLNAAGEVWEAGYNGDGELGLGDNTDRAYWSMNPYFSYQSDVIAIACGYEHSLFIDVNGNLFSSGYGAYGQLGGGSTATENVPFWVPSVSCATGIAGGWGHSLILTAPQ